MKVLKFGGSSVGTADRIKNVVNLVQARKGNIVVLSAMSGNTNILVSISNTKSLEEVQALKDKILKALYELVSTPEIVNKGIEFIFSFLKCAF